MKLKYWSCSETSVSEQLPCKNSSFAGRRPKNCETCETTNRVVEQVHLFFLISLAIIGCRNNGNIYRNNLNYGSFYYFQRWDGVSGNNEVVATGVLIINVNIDNINDNNRVKINIEMSMTGSGVLRGDAIAGKVNEKYEFSFIDNWDNNAFGNIIFNNDGTVTLYLDSNELSDFGKTRVGRLYGSTYILQRGVMEFY